jgi:Ca2+-binding EF-hand superfamily protein
MAAFSGDLSMKRATTILAFFCGTALLALHIPFAAAQSQNAADMLQFAIDPYNSVQQRGVFMRAAGVDIEMSQEEFAADAKSGRGFVRVFDQWSDFARFDANKNGTIDFFEAEKCRQDQRKRVLAAYDANKDGVLAGDERANANKALAAGKLPAATRQPESDTVVEPFDIPRGGGSPAAGGGSDGDSGDRPSREERMAAFAKQYDKDGDGRLSREERGEGMREEWRKRADTDGDGEVSEEERDALRRQFRERMEAEQQRRREDMMKRYDKDGDGELGQEERDAMRKDMQERWQQQRTERRRAWLDEGSERALENYDTNKDGQLSDAEKDAAMEQMQKRDEERRQEWQKRLLERYDKNKDGEIDEEERAEMRNQFRRGGRRGNRGGGEGEDGARRGNRGDSEGENGPRRGRRGRDRNNEEGRE